LKIGTKKVQGGKIERKVAVKGGSPSGELWEKKGGTLLFVPKKTADDPGTKSGDMKQKNSGKGEIGELGKEQGLRPTVSERFG